MPADRRPAEFDDLDEDFQAPQDPRTSRDVYQVAGGLNTPPEGIIAPRLNMKKREEPEPEDPNKDDDPRIKQVKVENLGRTRVYRVVRSYKSQTSAETPCQVCGSLVPPDAKRCPTCGHVL
jgi:hypothetical protein